MNSALPERTRRRRAAIVATLIVVIFAAILVVQSLLSTGPAASSQTPAASSQTPAASSQTPLARPDGDPLSASDGVVAKGERLSVFDDAAAVTNLDSSLRAALERAARAASADGVELRVNSGWRSPDYQRELLSDAESKYGSPEEAARWVAPAESSEHVLGDAVDIGAWDAAEWLGRHGTDYGLCTVYDNEPWHFELRSDAANDGCPPMYRNAAERQR